MIRLVASDIDGTLLPYGEKEISGEIFDLIRRLERKGILFCPASGRQYTSVRKLFTPVADHIPYLCENGAVVFGPGSPGPVLGKTPMDRVQAEAACRHILSLEGREVLISGLNTSYLCPKEASFIPVMEQVGNNLALLPRPEDTPEDMVKLAAYCPGRLEETCRVLTERWGAVFHVAIAGECWVDLTLADKGTGLAQLCAALGISAEEVMAFGDNYNDVPMLEWAGRPYLMENVAPALRAQYPSQCRRVAEVLEGLVSS